MPNLRYKACVCSDRGVQGGVPLICQISDIKLAFAHRVGRSISLSISSSIPLSILLGISQDISSSILLSILLRILLRMVSDGAEGWYVHWLH